MAVAHGTMLLSEVVSALDGELLCGDRDSGRTEFGACFAADLMSEVLAFCAPGALLVTGLVSVQSVHTADVADLAGIVFVNSARPGPEVIELATERRIPLVATRLPMFTVCGILHERGMQPAARR